jgi:hypothetical protein
MPLCLSVAWHRLCYLLNMRAGALAIIVGLVFVGGCMKREQPKPAYTGRWHEDRLQYRDAGEAALAMDPPVTLDGPRLALARAPRERSAFLGFEQTTATWSWVRMDDRQTEDGRNDRLERRAVSVRVGTSVR